MAIEQVYIPFPDLKLMEVIDPEEHDANNAALVQTINGMVTILNSFINGEANDNLSAMAVHVPAIEPFAETNVEQLFRDLIGRLISSVDGLSGADLIGATEVEGLEGNTVQSQLDSLRTILALLDESSSGTGLELGIHKGSGDHDLRYYRKEETDAKYTPLVGDHKGTFHGMTKEELLSASGTGFGSIEVLAEDPVNPKVGRIWILSTEADAGIPDEDPNTGGSVFPSNFAQMNNYTLDKSPQTTVDAFLEKHKALKSFAVFTGMGMVIVAASASDTLDLVTSTGEFVASSTVYMSIPGEVNDVVIGVGEPGFPPGAGVRVEYFSR